MPPEADPYPLFSPQPAPPTPDPMVGERGDDSALFELSRLSERGAQPTTHREDESSGLVNLGALTPTTRRADESSGLVDILKLVPSVKDADADPSPTARTRPPAVLSLVGPAPLGPPPTRAPAVDAEPDRAPAVPTSMLLAAIVVLLVAAAALTWKLLQ